MEENEWSWNEQAHPMTVNTMLGCVTELATAAQRLPIATTQSDESTAVLLLQTAGHLEKCLVDSHRWREWQFAGMSVRK